jgi:hypothetical protein
MNCHADFTPQCYADTNKLIILRGLVGKGRFAEGEEAALDIL